MQQHTKTSFPHAEGSDGAAYVWMVRKENRGQLSLDACGKKLVDYFGIVILGDMHTFGNMNCLHNMA